MKIYAIILNYNTSHDCKKCVSYLKRQDYKELSIMVVDNNSTCFGEKERLHKICQEYGVELIECKENKGFSAGNNIGLRKALEQGADWCLVINPDVELRYGSYISYMCEQFEKWPLAVVVASNVVLPNGQRQNPQRESNFFEEFFWPIQLLKAKIKKNYNWYVMPSITEYCDKLTGCCFFIKADFLNQINFLDQNIFMYSEEAILSKQVKKLNYKELYISEVTVNHEHYTNSKDSIKSRMLKKIESRNYYIKEYSGLNSFKIFLLLISNKVLYIYWCKKSEKGSEKEK